MTQIMFVYSNSAGGQSVIADPSANRTISIQDANGTVALVDAIAVAASTLSNGSVQFSNSNGVTFGMNGSTVTMGVQPISYWDNRKNLPPFALVSANLNSDSASAISFQRLMIRNPISATRMDVIALLSAAPVLTAGYRLEAGIFTMNASTAALASSGGIDVTFSNGAGSAVSEYNGQSGMRWRSVPLGTWNITPGDYLLGVAAVNLLPLITETLAIYGRTNPVVLGVDAVTSLGYFADGLFNSSGGTSPFGVGGAATSVAMAAIQQADTALTGILAQPYVRFIGTGP